MLRGFESHRYRLYKSSLIFDLRLHKEEGPREGPFFRSES